jgi:thiosulfate reductase cytochrome b subunit
MNEREQIERDDESTSAAESCPKPAIDQPAAPPGSLLKVEGTENSSDAPTQLSNMGMGMTITIEHKHSLAIRWMHWINFPLLVVMIYSGLLIYWADSQHEGLNAHRVYRVGFGSWTLFRLFPSWFYNNLHLKFQLAKGLGYHFFFMWFFALNGMAYVLYTIFSGEWRELLPTRHSFREAVEVTLHDLGLRKRNPPQGKFNGAQRIAYTGVICMGVGSLLTGLAIYKPTQLHLLTSLLGGYEMARWLHFWLTTSYVVFFFGARRTGHSRRLEQLSRHDRRLRDFAERSDEARRAFSMNRKSPQVERDTIAELKRRSRRGFLTAAVAAVAGGSIWKWLNSRPEVDGLGSPFRKAMQCNAGIARRLFGERALAHEFEQSVRSVATAISDSPSSGPRTGDCNSSASRTLSPMHSTPKTRPPGLTE